MTSELFLGSLYFVVIQGLRGRLETVEEFEGRAANPSESEFSSNAIGTLTA
jgi:hypothetical protein